MKTQIFHIIKYDLKGQKTTFMPKSFYHIRLWTDFIVVFFKDTTFHKIKKNKVIERNLDNFHTNF